MNESTNKNKTYLVSAATTLFIFLAEGKPWNTAEENQKSCEQRPKHRRHIGNHTASHVTAIYERRSRDENSATKTSRSKVLITVKVKNIKTIHTLEEYCTQNGSNFYCHLFSVKCNASSHYNQLISFIYPFNANLRWRFLKVSSKLK